VGAQPIEQFKQIIDEERALATGLPPPVAANPPPRPAPIVFPSLRWPPPRLVLPDDQLGEPLAIPAPPESAPIRGEAAAPVEVSYFVDYEDRWRRSGKPLVDGLLASYPGGIRVVVRPMRRTGEPSETLAAEAAWAAADQGKFWQVHEALLEVAGSLDRQAVEAIAARVGLDPCPGSRRRWTAAAGRASSRPSRPRSARPPWTETCCWC
jgi:hypothetical protein